MELARRARLPGIEEKLRLGEIRGLGGAAFSEFALD